MVHDILDGGGSHYRYSGSRYSGGGRNLDAVRTWGQSGEEVGKNPGKKEEVRRDPGKRIYENRI